MYPGFLLQHISHTRLLQVQSQVSVWLNLDLLCNLVIDEKEQNSLIYILG